MTSLQLQQKVQSLIKSIIVKHPKIESDILYLRGVFIDSVTELNKDYWKVVKKYDKLKERFKLKEQSGLSGSNGSYSRGGQVRSPHQRKSNNKEQQIQSTRQTFYDINLMTIILSQAKSIKSIFQQTLKLSTQQQQYTKTTKILNIYNAYKQFYKTFKQRHKQYLHNFSYDEKHIHKNSTQMKQRLIQELKRQIQKRKQLQQKLSVLENSIQKALRHKNQQIQQLRMEIQEMKNDNYHQHQNKQQKTLSGHQQFIFVTRNKKVQKNYETSNKQNNKNVSHFLSDSQSSPSQKLNQHFNKLDSQQNGQTSQQQQQSGSQQIQNSSQQKRNISRLPDRSNLGKFYMGSDLIKTGKINNSQIRKSTNDNDRNEDKKSRNEDNLQVQSTKIYQANSKRCQQHKMTFGNQYQVTKQNGKRQTQTQKMSRQKLVDTKSLQKQMHKLKQQLQRQRKQKQSLKQKIKQSDSQYHKLQQQVNELYKMMNSKQQQSQQVKKQNIIKTQKQPNNHQQSPTSKWKVNSNKGKIPNKQIKLSKQQQSNKLSQSNYDQCQDIEEIIAKAEKSFLHNNNLMTNKKYHVEVNNNNNNYQISFGDVLSPIGKKSLFNKNDQQKSVIKLVSPPKNNTLVKAQSLKSNRSFQEQSRITPNKTTINNQFTTNINNIKSPNNNNTSKNPREIKQLQKSSLYNEKNQTILQSQLQKPTLNKDISSLSIRSYSNNKILSPYKNLPPMSSRNRMQNQMKAELQQIQQYYAERIKEKDEEALLFQQEAQRSKIKANQLMMMLLTQAGALQEIILSKQIPQQYPQEQN